MNETSTEAINVLGQVQFETGGTLLKHIVSLKRELLVERQRRIEVLCEAGMTDVQVGEHADVHRLAEHRAYAL
jgi:hypothetical protein